MDYNKRKKMYIFGGAGMALVIIVIIFCIAFSSCGGGNYDKHYDAAELAFLSGDYDTALKELEKALDVKPTEECYLLMAEVYNARNDLDMAIQVLYLGYSRLGSSAIADRLEELKALKNGGAQDNGGTITIAGEDIAPDVTSLVLNGKKLTDSDIRDLDRLTELESLSLSDNKLTDLSPLSGLTKLSSLQLSDNNISDLSPLSGLTQLKTLYLDGNPIQDFTPLYSLSSLKTLSMKDISVSTRQLEELQEALPDCSIYADEPTDEAVEITLGGKTFMSDVTELNLGGLEIEDISALSQCTKLVKLDLRDNSITDISALVDLQDLEWLCLWNNQVEDLRPLMTLTKLTYLDADDNQIKDLTVLEYLTGLEELWLSGNELSGNFKHLSGLSSLKRLGLKNTGLEDKDLDILSKLTTLEELTIEDNEALSANKVEELKEALPDCAIAHSELLYSVKLGSQEFKSDATEISAVSCGVKDLSGLEKFTSLKKLTLTGNSVSDLSPLKDIKTLEELELYGNKVSDLSPLKDHSALHVLNLQNNDLTDISALGSCVALRELHLSGNRITDVSPLANCTELTELDLDDNGLTDISVLAALTSLKSLSLENNSISDLSSLYTLTLLESLHIRGNDVTAQDIQALQRALPNCAILTDVDMSVLNEPETTPAPEDGGDAAGNGGDAQP